MPCEEGERGCVKEETRRRRRKKEKEEGKKRGGKERKGSGENNSISISRRGANEIRREKRRRGRQRRKDAREKNEEEEREEGREGFQGFECFKCGREEETAGIIWSKRVKLSCHSCYLSSRIGISKSEGPHAAPKWCRVCEDEEEEELRDVPPLPVADPNNDGNICDISVPDEAGGGADVKLSLIHI